MISDQLKAECLRDLQDHQEQYRLIGNQADSLAYLHSLIADCCHFAQAHITLLTGPAINSSASLSVQSFIAQLFIQKNGNAASFLEQYIPSFCSSSQKPFHIKATDVTNLIAIVDEQDHPCFLLIAFNASLQSGHLAHVLYDIENDAFHLVAPVLNNNYLAEILQRLIWAFGWLPKGIGAAFLLKKEYRKSIVDSISLRNGYALFLENKYDHLGHYFMNFVGPLSYYCAHNIIPAGLRVFLGARPSWLGGFEQELLLPSLHGFGEIQENTVFVNGVLDALKLSRDLNLGLLKLSDACVSRSLSISFRDKLVSWKAPESYSEFRLSKDNELYLGLGLRGGTRMVLNFNEFVVALIKELQSHISRPICVIVDGMCRSLNPENSTTANLSLADEHNQCNQLRDELAPCNVRVESVIGMDLVTQLNKLSLCSVVIAHNGSSSAKYLWALNLPTVILNCPTSESTSVYVSRDDLDAENEVGLCFGRAFRGEAHSPELYISRSLLRASDAHGKIESPAAQSRFNSYLDIDSAIPPVSTFVRNALAVGSEGA
jgi:hypothetical protein